MKQYYELLGLNETATDEEITNRYNELMEKYREERWQDGEAGNEAARMLTKLDTAYREIMSSRKEQEKNTEGQNSFEEVSALLKEDKIAEAQALLDDFNERNAEWHYLQAAIYYKKNWTNDSKKQLEIAIEIKREKRLSATAGASAATATKPVCERRSLQRANGGECLLELYFLLLYLSLCRLFVQPLLRLQIRKSKETAST